MYTAFPTNFAHKFSSEYRGINAYVQNFNINTRTYTLLLMY